MKYFYFFVAFLFLSIANAQIVNIPDANFKAKLLEASSSNQIASTQTPNSNGNVTTYTSIDINNDGEIQVSEASLIKYLAVSNSSISSLVGIESFTNLTYLNCYNNNLTSLNLSSLTSLQELNCAINQLPSLNLGGLTGLQKLYCFYNQLPSLYVTGLSSLQELDCSYNQLPSLNVSGLTSLQRLVCDNNQFPSLNVNGLTSLQFLSCNDNQLPSLNVSGLSSLQFLICNYNQLLSLNISGLTNLEYLDCSFNQLPILNVSGLTNLEYLDCFGNQLTSLNVSGLTNLNYLNCGNNQLNSLFIKNNNISWQTLEFNNNPNLAYICADEEDLTFIQNKINSYSYTATCNLNSYCSFTPGSIFYTIQGNSKIDINNNGCNLLDSVYPNLKFNITNGTILGSFISNTTGNYSIPVQAGTHTITPQLENLTYFTVSPTSVTVTFPATTSPFTQNFCIVPNGVKHDLEVVIIPVDDARPGFDATYKIKYKNKGNQSENATINFDFNDAVLDYVTSSIAPTTQTIGILAWNVGTIQPFQSGEILVTLNVNSPMETPAVNDGDILSYYATAIVTTTDETPDDNTAVLSQIVVNSFDPNDKTCLEGNVINPSMIGKYVHYKIRFENTGTFAAQNIVVKDIIDTTKFDMATLQLTDSSHSCVTKVSNTNKVEFIFENINLPFADATNDGYVVFKIKTKSTLTLNSTISNLANIYFDYNFPIVTNTATSTFTTLGNDAFAFNNYFTIYPNPVSEVLSLKAKKDAKILSLSLYTTLGQLVQTIVNPTSSLDVADLKTGNYIVKVVTDKGVSSNKFVKE